MSIHIKQLKGANDLIERDEFVKNNLIGKMKLKDGSLMLSVPLKIEKTVEDVPSDFSLLNKNDFVTKEYVDTSISALKGDVSANYDTLREIEDNIKSISATAGVDPISAESKSSKGIEIGSISIGDNTVTFYIDLSNYVEKSGENAAFTTVPTAPSISSAYDDNKLVTASFVHEVERKLIGAIDDDTIEVLTTLSDISAAINNDPEYYSTVQEALNAKLNKSDISIIPESSTGTPIGKIILDEDTYEFKVDLSALDFFNSPNFTGEPTVPDVAQGDSSSLVANTRFVTTAVSNAVSSVKGEPPDNLNTLQKISTAIGNDSAFAANVNSSLSTIDSTVSDLNIAVSSAVESIDSVNNNKQSLSNALTSISSLPTEADRMIYTTAKDIYAVTTLTGSARTLISKTDEQGMRDYLSVPKADGTGASGSWSITADKALKDKDGNPIDTTYLKTVDAVNVSVSNLVTGTDVTRLGTITIGDKSHDINVDLSSYAPLSNATLTGTPAAPSPTLTDSSTRIATTGFVQSVVSGAIDDLVGEGTPEALNTLKEIADIIGSDADFTGSIITELSNKVSKEEGKGLSTNDFTTAEKNKLSGIEAGANSYSLPAATTTTKGGVIVGTGLSVKDGKVSLETATNSAIGGIKLGNGVTTTTGGVVSVQSATTDQNGLMTKEQVSKLNSIAAGAEVNVINRVKVNDTVLPISDKTVTVNLTDYVQKDGTKVLSDNNYTTEEKSKLAGIEAGAQVNKINAIKVNGTFVEPDSDKAINITVSGGGDYILPNATTTNKGGIIVGNGLAVNNATVSVATATTDKIGGIKLGNGVTTTTGGIVSIQSATSGQNGLMTSDQASKLAGITAGAEVNKINIVKVNGTSLTPDTNKAVNITVPDISGKVDKVDGKGLSTNDFTKSYKDKLDSIADNATKDNVSIIAGTVNSTVNTAITSDPYINLTDNNVKKGSVQIKGGDKVTVSSDASGVITIKSSDTTYDVVSRSSNGLVPSLPSDNTQFLRSDGKWATLAGSDTTYEAGNGISLNSSNNAFSVKVPANSGLSVTTNGVSLTAAQTNVIGGVKVAAVSTSNISLGSDGNISVPAASSSQAGVVKLGGGTTNYLRADGSWATPPDTNTTYSAGTGISLTGTTFKAHPDYIGNVKKDTTDTGSGKFLKADGTWAVPPDTNTTYSAGTGISLSGTTFKADPNYLGSVQKGTGTTTYLRADGTWNTPPDTNTTYSGSNGISVSGTVISADSDYIGSVKKDATSGSSGKFLKADGTWATPPDTNSTYNAGNGLQLSSGAFSVKTPANSGLSVTTNGISVTAATTSAIGGVKVAAVTSSNINLGTDGSISVPLATASQAGAVKIGTNLSVNNGTISLSSSNVTGALGFTPANSADVLAAATVMTGASASASGKSGLVPAPAKGNQDKFLKGDGTWATPPDTNTTYSAGTGLSLSGTTFSANSNYLGSIQKSTGTTNFLRADGTWAVPPGTVTNTDAKVAQNVSTTDKTYPILLAATADAVNNIAATNVIFGKGVKVNPSKSVITAATFDGMATKASLDSAGNTITSHYAPLANPVFTGTVKAPNVSLSGTATIPTVTVTTKLTAAAITGSAVHSQNTAGDLGWVNKATDGLQVITKNSLAYWNGRYQEGKSNLLYCSLGAFGTAATTDANTYPSLASNNTLSGTNTFTGRVAIKERLMMPSGLAMSSLGTINTWASAQDNAGNLYTPYGGIAWYWAKNSATGIFGFSRGSIGSQVDNILITTGAQLVLSAGEVGGLDILRNANTPKSIFSTLDYHGYIHMSAEYDIEFLTKANDTLNGPNRFVFERNGNASIPGVLKTSQILIPARNDSLHYWGSQKGTDSTASNAIDKTPHIHFYQDTDSMANHAFSGLYGIDKNSKSLWVHGYNHLVLSASAPAIGAVRGAGTKTTGGELYFENLGLLNNIANDNIIADSDGASINADIHLMAPYIYFHVNDSIGTDDSLKSNANLNTNFINRQGTLHLCNSLLFYARKDSINNSSYSQHSLPSSNTDGIDLYIAHGIIANSIPSANFLSCYNSLSASVEPSGYIAWRLHDSGYTTGIFPVRAYNAAAMNNLLVNAANSLVLASGKNSGLNLIRRYGTDSLFASTFNSNGTTFVMGDTSVELLTNCSQDSITPHRFTFNKTGYAEFPELRLDRPLSVRNGGTGVTVASDLIDVMGLGNGTGNYFCNLSTESLGHSILTNDTTTSPMPGFNALRDGMTVHMFVTQHPTSSAQAHLSFNGTPAHGVYSIDGSNGKAVSVVAKSLQAAHCYKAIYHSTAFGVSTSPAPAYTWLLYPEF